MKKFAKKIVRKKIPKNIFFWKKFFLQKNFEKKVCEKIFQKNIFFEKNIFQKKFAKRNFSEKIYKIFFVNIGWSKFKWVEIEKEWKFLTTVG